MNRQINIHQILWKACFFLKINTMIPIDFLPCVCICMHIWVRKKERKRMRYQATAIQLAGERSTLRNDIKPGYLWANPLIWKQNAQKVSTESYYFNTAKGTWRICCTNGPNQTKILKSLILLNGIKDSSCKQQIKLKDNIRLKARKYAGFIMNSEIEKKNDLMCFI